MAEHTEQEMEHQDFIQIQNKIDKKSIFFEKTKSKSLSFEWQKKDMPKLILVFASFAMLAGWISGSYQTSRQESIITISSNDSLAKEKESLERKKILFEQKKYDVLIESYNLDLLTLENRKERMRNNQKSQLEIDNIANQIELSNNKSRLELIEELQRIHPPKNTPPIQINLPPLAPIAPSIIPEPIKK